MEYNYGRPTSSFFLVAYDVNRREKHESPSITQKRRKDVLDEIEKHGPCVPLSESAYALKTSSSALTIARAVRGILLKDVDEFTVVELRGPAHGMNVPTGNQSHRWLLEMLGESVDQ